MIDPPAHGPSAMDYSDVDGDGDLDLIMGSTDVGVPLESFYGWYENLGSHFSTVNMIDDEIGQALETSMADIDGDGDEDFILLTFDPAQVVLYRNLGGGACFCSYYH